MDSPATQDPLEAWDRACRRAQTARGLGFELLSRCLPAAPRGSALAARCPEPALLGFEAARVHARSFLREELADSLLELELLAPDGSEDWSLSFHARAERDAEARRERAWGAFASEELSARAEAFGAALDPASFRAWP